MTTVPARLTWELEYAIYHNYFTAGLIIHHGSQQQNHTDECKE